MPTTVISFSEAAPQYLPTYDLQKSITVEAEKLDYDFALSMVKYRGFGGSTEFWDYYSETFTLMAALAETTEKLMLIATAGILSVHPQFAARMIAMIDDVSGGLDRLEHCYRRVEAGIHAIRGVARRCILF